MRVSLDIQAAIGRRAGVGRYVYELLQHLPEEAGQDELRAFYFDFKRTGMEVPQGIQANVCRWLPGRVAQGLWKTIGFPPYQWLAGGADVYHFPNFIRPPLPQSYKSVVTVHDLSFLRFPETTERKNLAWLKANIRQTVDRADALIGISRFSASEIVELLNVPEEKVFAIPLGLPSFGPPPDEAAVAAVKQQLGLEKPYLLMVGTIEPRKNIPFLIKAFEALKTFDGELILVGGLGWKTEESLAAISASPRAADIRLLQNVDDRQLSVLYAGAELFVFPTLYEGFGFPPLEAMARGTPVVAARNSSLPEVLGDAAAWVDGFNAVEWAQAIEKVLGDEARRAQMRQQGAAQATKFTWQETARRTWEVYRRVAGG